MQSAEERRRLMNHLDGESISPIWVVLRCAAGILALAVVAAGPWVLLSASGPAIVPAAGEQTATRANRPVPSNLAESKRVFDERRERYEAARKGGAAEAPGDGVGNRLLARE